MKWVSTVRMRQGLGWLGVVAVLAVLHPAVPSAQSPISTAAKAGDRAAVRRLVAGGANVNTPAADGSTALLWAVYNSDLEMVRSLIAAGAKVDAANRYGMTPLLQASRTGDMPIMEALLKAGASSKLTHEDGETPLMAAARAGRVDAVRLLLARGADVNGTDLLQDQTPLMWAAGEGHTEVVSALLEAGAKPNLQARKTALTVRSHADHPSGGFTALMWAARNGHEDTVRTLAKAGADLNAKNGDNASATIIAIANDRLDMANLLLDLGADPNDGALYFAVDQHDGTTDMRAKDGGLLRWDHPNKVTTMDLIKRLLAMGADPNKAFQGQLHSISMANPDNHNASAFYRAAVAADVEALKVILPKADLKWMPSAPPAGGRGGNLGRSAVMAASVGGRGASFGGGPGFGRIDKPVWREAGSRTPAEAVELLIKAGADLPKKYDLSSLRLLGSVGEPINPEAWMWYHETVGGGRCPIVDTWWQTETGGHMITPLPGATPTKPGSATFPLPGIITDIVDETGLSVGKGKGGILVIKRPWPSMIRTIWGDPDRYRKSYFPDDFQGRYYLAGDGASTDQDGYYRIMGRIDDVLNVSGHRLGTMEIESALVANTKLVAEAAVVGRPDELTGEAVCAFVVLKGARPSGEEAKKIAQELRNWVAKEIGPIARPKDIRFGDNLPKTRSGKIMRRLLRAIAKGEEIKQDVSTLENPAILEQLKQAS